MIESWPVFSAATHARLRDYCQSLLALFTDPSVASAAPRAATGTPLAGPAANRAREALDRYNQAIERLKSGDWAGFGTKLDAMRELLEDMSRQPGGH
jgi:uncharacterized protein